MGAELTIVYGGMLEGIAGPGAGLPREALVDAAEQTPRWHAGVRSRRESGAVGFFDLPGRADALTEIEAAAARLKSEFKNLLVLGIGGSALGTTALVKALTPAFSPKPGAMRVFCLDNVDPAWFAEAVRAFPPEETAYAVISKSGGTPETMAQYLVVKEILATRFPKDFARHLVYITDATRGPLRAEAAASGALSFVVPGNVGGRFSVLCPVGLLPAACAGIDVRALLRGAAEAQAACEVPDLLRNPGYLFGALLALADRRLGKRLHVLMPYRQGLWETALWFRQLWAESLGKNEATGPTPIAALGATDQHSQAQLYVEGPKDKVVVFLEIADHGADVPIPGTAIEGLEYLAGASLARLLAAELTGTRAALLAAGRPVLTVRLKALDEQNVGALLQTLMVATAFAGEIYGVDAYDQPGVEAGKVNAAALLGRRGQESKAAMLRRSAEEVERFRLSGGTAS